MIYYIVFILLLAIQMLGRARDRAWVYWPTLIFLFAFSAFRFQVGCDWNNYLLNFIYLKNQYGDFTNSAINLSYWLILEFMDYADLDYYWLNIFTSAIFFAGLHAIARRSTSPLAVLAFAFPILILNMPMSAVKQAAAIGIVCFAMNAFIDRRLVLFVLLTLLAASFHSSAMIIILLAPFIYGRLTPANLLLAGLLTIPGVLALLASDPAELASSRYISGTMEAGGAVFRVSLIAATGFFFILVLRKRWNSVLPESYKLVSLLSLGMIALVAILPISSVIADRLGYYFVIPQIMIYAALPALYPGRQSNTIKLAPFVAVTVLFISWIQLSSHFRWCYEKYSIVPALNPF